MATYHYFHVKHVATGKDHLVRAPRPSAALAVIAGDRTGVKQATNEEIEEHFVAGLSAHEKSVSEGEGKWFLIKGTPNVLIRAKNAASAFDAVSDGSYTVTKCDQDMLVRLLDARVKPVKFEDQPRNDAGERPEATLDASNDDGNAAVPAHSDGATGAEEIVAPAVATDGSAVAGLPEGENASKDEASTDDGQTSRTEAA